MSRLRAAMGSPERRVGWHERTRAAPDPPATYARELSDPLFHMRRCGEIWVDLGRSGTWLWSEVSWRAPPSSRSPRRSSSPRPVCPARPPVLRLNPRPRNCPAEGVRTHTAAVPTSIDGTGATDVTVELEAWLQSLAPDTRAVLAADAVYRAEKPIRLERKQALTIDGNGARLLRTEPGDPDESKTRTNASLDLYSGFDIVIKNLEIYGAHDRRAPQYRRDFEAQHGIDVAGVASLVICHNQIVNVLGDFVYFGASGTAQAGDRTASAYVDIYENYFALRRAAGHRHRLGHRHRGAQQLDRGRSPHGTGHRALEHPSRCRACHLRRQQGDRHPALRLLNRCARRGQRHRGREQRADRLGDGDRDRRGTEGGPGRQAQHRDHRQHVEQGMRVQPAHLAARHRQHVVARQHGRRWGRDPVPTSTRRT